MKPKVKSILSRLMCRGHGLGLLQLLRQAAQRGIYHFGHLPKSSQSLRLNARWNGSVAMGMGSQLSQSAGS